MTGGTIGNVYGASITQAYRITGTTGFTVISGNMVNYHAVTQYLLSPTGNTVNIIDGTVNQNVYGGYTESSITYLPGTGTGTYVRTQVLPGSVTQNTVNVSGGTISGSVYG